MKNTAIVTGASSGIGREISRVLVEMGYEVYGFGREFPEEEVYFHPIVCDLLNTPELERQIKEIRRRNDVSLLVNNAGLGLGLESADKASLDDWMQMIDTNIKGLVTITRLVLPQMVERNSGHIINLGSIAGTYPYPGGNVYGGTKAFIKQFSLNLRADLAGTQIRVSNVEPGLCGGTEFSNIRFKGDDARAKKLYENVEYVSPQDIANIVLWLNQQPEHVNINRIEVMPTAQTFAPLNVARIQK